MNFDDLQLIKHLAGTLHFSKTSKAFHMSASNLTRRIHLVEAELGVLLFERDNRNVHITRHGKQFLEFSEYVTDDFERLKESFSSDQGKVGGTLKIYGSVTACYGVLPPLLKRFQKTYPNVGVELRTGSVTKVIDELRERRADIGVMPITDDVASDIVAQQITQIPLVFIQAFRSRKQIDWKRDTILLPETGITRQIVDNWFETEGISPKNIQNLSEFEGILSLVSAGYGVGLVPQIVWSQSSLRDTIEVLSVRPGLPQLNIAVVALKKRADVARISAFFTMR